MHIPEILREDVRQFLQTHHFDLYIGNPFSAAFFPSGSDPLIVTRANYSDLPKFKGSMKNSGASILAFGAGSVFDPAKYIASVTNSHLTIIPSALSVNSFTTHRGSFFDGHSNKSINTITPNVIVLDFDLLKGAGILNTLGIVELASTATAQVDWSLAAEEGLEREDVHIRERSNVLIEKTIDLLKNCDTISERLEELFEGLFESGLLTQAYGSGRPVSGSEHTISSYIENQSECAHGAGLYIGILIAVALQKLRGKETREVKLVANYLWKNNLIREHIKKQFDKKVIEHILSIVRPQEGKYTIIDDCHPEVFRLTAQKVCDKLFE